MKTQFKKILMPGLLAITAFLFGCSGGWPSESAGQQVLASMIQGQSNGNIKLVNFRKTNATGGENCRCKFLSVICFSSIRLGPFGTRRSEGERSEPSAAESQKGRGVPRTKNWSRAGHCGFLLGCSQTQPTENLI